MLKIAYKATPLGVLRRMQPKVAHQIRKRIMAVAAEPSDSRQGIVPLSGRPGFRLRVGRWRVIFDMDAEVLDVLAIETRGDVYKPRKRR